MRLFTVFLFLVGSVRAGLTDELLEMDAPARDWSTDQRVLAEERSEPPPADGPIEELFAYWREYDHGDLEPDTATRDRFLLECERNLRLVPRVWWWVPESPRALTVMKRWLAAGRPGAHTSGFDTEETDWWCLLVDPDRREELFRRAREEGDPQFLEAVAESGGEEAWHLLRVWASRDEESATHAAALLFWHAPEDLSFEALHQLLRIGADSSADPERREIAMDALRDAKWPGRATWWRERLEDLTLRDRTWDLAELVRMDRARWVPVLASLAERPDEASRTHAAAVLLAVEEPEPLLPWLADAKWCALENRVDFIRLLQRVPVPEAADGLWELKGSDRERDAALLALASLGDQRAGPETLARFSEVFWSDRPAHFRAIRASGGITTENAIGFVAALARKRAELRSDTEAEDWWVNQMSRGMMGTFLVQEPGEDAEPIAEALITKAEEGPVGNEMRALAYGLAGAKMAGDFAARLAKGAVDLRSLLRAVRNRPEIRRHVEGELRLITEGEKAGFAAAIIEDAALQGLCLRRDDPAAAEALLAVARVTRLPLAVEAVQSTLAKPELYRAALLYLESADTPASRAALREHFADRPLLLGGSAWRFPSRKLESIDDDLAMPFELLEEFSTGALDIHQWTRWSDLDGGWDRTTIRRFPDRIEYAFSDAAGREWYRGFDRAEWEHLRGFLDRVRIEEVPSQEYGKDGISYRYTHATPAGGFAVSAQNPEEMLYQELDVYLTHPFDRGDFKLRYDFAEEEPRLEVLVARRYRDVRQFLIREGGLLVELVPDVWRVAEEPEWHRVIAGKLGPAIPDPEPDQAAASGKRVEIEAGVLWFDGDLRFAPKEGASRVLLENVRFRRAYSSDRRWLLVEARIEDGYQDPIQLFLVDLRDASVRPAGRRAHESQRVHGWVPIHSAFLCSDGEDNHFLLDPTSAKSTTVEGEFRPLHGRTDPERTFWAKIWDGQSWRVGRYDSLHFTFDEVRQFPADWIHVDQIHADARRNLLYVLYEGHLLRMPLRQR